MARGPFQGTFSPNARPTVATAPDAVVHINGEAEIAGCPQCSRTFDLNKYITSITTNLSVDSPPGSASISLAIPRHSIDDFYFDGNPIITTMMEVEIYAKGNFLVEGLPQYYPIFWGIVTEVQDAYSGGEHTVSIQCADILKWWELCKTNINPAAIGQPGDQGRNLLGNVFASRNAYDIIFTLASQSFGDVLIGTGSVQNFIRDTAEQDAALTDMTLYWEKRFSKMRSNLVLYGTSGVAVRGDTLFQGYSRNPSENMFIASTTIRDANGEDGGQMYCDPAGEASTAFKTDYQQAGIGGLTQAEYQTKLEIAVACKEAAGFEFYMDVTGDIIFKPPFYNLDVLGNKPLSWIQDIDVIDWDFSESEAEVVTQIIMEGQHDSRIALPLDSSVLPKSTVTDYHLLRKYGWRVQNYNAEFMTNPIHLFYHGLDLLDRINSKRHRGNVTIPMRSELRLGFPIYIAPKDEIWYVSGISHSISFGGRASTTLQLTSRRSKFIAPRGIGTLKLTHYNKEAVPEPDKDGAPKTFRYSSRQLQKNATFKLDRDDALEVPGNEAAFAAAGVSNPAQPLILRHPKTGRIVGYPNVTMVYSRPFADSDVTKVVGQQSNDEAMARLPKEAREVARQSRERYEQVQQKQLTAGEDSVIQGKYTHRSYQYGMNAAGVFIYAHDVNAVIREALNIKTTNILPEQQTHLNQANPDTFIRPVSDERGFEVIGHYQYGRRVSLRDGRLILNSPGLKAKVDLQLALSGDLSSILAAQSQGLTTVITGYADPAAELAELTPEDTQTAAAFPASDSSPNRKTPVFTNIGDEFIEDAPLGSQEQRGVLPTVEASQLSRALSLAEMAVLDGATVVDEDCACITGRADLAFMGSNYQVESLNPASVDLAELGDRLQGLGSIAEAKIRALKAKINVSQEASDILDEQKRKLSATALEQEQPVTPEERAALDLASNRIAAERKELDADLANARKEYAEESGGPIQIVSAVSLEQRVTSLKSAIEAAKKEKAELEEKQFTKDLASKKEARISELQKQIEATKRKIEDLMQQPFRGVLDAAEPVPAQDPTGFEPATPAPQTPTGTTLERQRANEAEISKARQLLEDHERELQNLRESEVVESITVKLQRLNDSIALMERQVTDAQSDVTEQHSQRSGSIFGMTNKEVVSRVEKFLVDLYTALDGAHQTFEKAIRGDLMAETNASFKTIHQPGVSVAAQRAGNPNGPDLAPVSEFAPPFSAPQRFQLGDPNAAVGAVQSNAKEIADAWSGFSRDMQNSANSRALSTQLSQDRSSIARLTASRDQLIKQRDSSTVVIGDVQKQIDTVSAQIAKLEQKVAENQSKLSEVQRA